MVAESKSCKYCGSEIGLNAIYCIHCNHYQNWRKYVNFGNSFLALTIALITVLSAFLPLVKKSFEEKKTILTVSFLEAVDNGFLLLVTNEGNQRGILANSRIKLNTGENREQFQFAILRNQSGTRIIEPKNAIELLIEAPQSNKLELAEFKYVLRLMHDDGKGSPQIASLNNNYLIISLIDHKGTKTEVELEIPQEQFKKWLDSLFPERNIPEGFRIP